MVLSVVLSDVDTRLRTHGTPTNTWSIGQPTYDLEYADDTLLFFALAPAFWGGISAPSTGRSLLVRITPQSCQDRVTHPSSPSSLSGSFCGQYGSQYQHGSQVPGITSFLAQATLTASLHSILLATTAFNKLSH